MLERSEIIEADVPWARGHTCSMSSTSDVQMREKARATALLEQGCEKSGLVTPVATLEALSVLDSGNQKPDQLRRNGLTKWSLCTRVDEVQRADEVRERPRSARESRQRTALSERSLKASQAWV
jgi:hypothetical protein